MSSEVQDTDKHLIRRLKQDDKRAFETLFYRYKARLYYFVLGYLKSEEETEEIVQNTFVSLWEHRHLLDENLPVKAYIFKIAVNAVYNYFKHEAVRQKFIDFTKSQKSNTVQSAQTDMEIDEALGELKSVLEQLPERQREVFQMSRGEGLSNTEIAKMLGLSVRSVENQVYRALKFIRSKLNEKHLIR